MQFENRFTERAKNAIKLSYTAAGELGHSYVGSEHLLLGLLKEGGGIAAKALNEADLTEKNIQKAVIEATGRGIPNEEAPQGLTPRAKRIIEYALSEAARYSHNYVGTEHILMGIIREKDNVAARILSAIGADLGKLYSSVVRMTGISEPMDSTAPQQPLKNDIKRDKGVETKTLDQFGRDLTDMARAGKLDPIIGRDKEIERIIQVLSRRTKNNPALIGEPGVGKTAIAEGLAQRIIAGDVPETLSGKRLVTLDLSGMIAGTKYRGEFENRIKEAIDEIVKAGNVILFIDEMHTLIGAGAAEGAIDAANILKPALSRGEFQVIGATTLNEYRKHIEKDAALERRFQPIIVGEPTQEDTVKILKGLRDRYEAHHRIKITDEAINAAVKLSSRYLPDRHLPDKAIDLIDEASSKMRMRSLTAPPNLKELEENIEKIRKEKEEAVRGQDFEKAAGLRDEEKKLKIQYESEQSTWKENRAKNTGEIGEEDIADIISSWTGIPVSRLTENEAERLLKMEEVLHKRIIGQNEAVTAVSKAIRRGRIGLKDPKRPVGSFIFLGPTGVGKTELSKALAEALFDDENALIRVDMSEYMEKHTVSRIIGSPPGYVGYDEGGQLTEKIRRKPYSVLLFDEVEKAHPDVFNILLQILEDGILTDAQGRRVDFKNTVIIMTSNIGARKLTERQTLGFSDAGDDKTTNIKEIRADIMAELKRAFRPEFLNRVDDIIVFHQLEMNEIKKIAEKMIDEVKSRVQSFGIELAWDEGAIELLASSGFDPVYGARPLRRAIQSKIEDTIAERVLDKSFKTGDKILATAKDGAVELVKRQN